MKLYKCQKCKNIFLKVIEAPCFPYCCGEECIELTPRSVDGAVEKHVPVVEINNNNLEVRVGEVDHPMTEDHYIMFIAIETSKGQMIKYLNPGDEPVATFTLSNEELINVYAYCNLHGLWNYK